MGQSVSLVVPGFLSSYALVFGLYWGEGAMSRSSTVWIATVISMHTFPSACPSILLEISRFGLHEIMSTLFFGVGGGELGDSSSVSLFLLFKEPLNFQLAFGVCWRFFFSIFAGLLVFVLAVKCCSIFLSRMSLPIMEGTKFVEIVRRLFVLRRVVIT